jgi:hypothetical protein
MALQDECSPGYVLDGYADRLGHLVTSMGRNVLQFRECFQKRALTPVSRRCRDASRQPPQHQMGLHPRYQ